MWKNDTVIVDILFVCAQHRKPLEMLRRKMQRVKVLKESLYTRLVQISLLVLYFERWGKWHHSHVGGGRGAVNQLPLSKGRRASASGGRQNRQRAVIMRFTHSRLLIASRWAAPTRYLECSVNSPPMLPLVSQQRGGRGGGSVWMQQALVVAAGEALEWDCSFALTAWWTADVSGSELPVIPQLKVTLKQSSSF